MAKDMIAKRNDDSIASKPLQRFKRLSGSLETLISAIAQDWEDQATEGNASGDSDKLIYHHMRKAQLLFTELHSSSRKMHVAIEGFRNDVATAKQSMDMNHLQLENLLYERDYLSRETQLCQDFTMTELGRMEQDEEQAFLEDVDTLQTREEHARNLGVLRDQKDKRTNAQLELEAVQIRVKAASAAVNDSSQYLDKLPDYLKDVEKALVPLRKNMPWRPGARRGRHEQAADLPGPLFTLFCQLEAYCDSVRTDESVGEDERAVSSLVDYGEGAADLPMASVSLVAARTYVSASAKLAAEGPNEVVERRASASKSPDGDSVSAKRQRRHYDQEDGRGDDGAEKRKVSSRDAGRSMLDALKPSSLEVLLTLNNIHARDAISKDAATEVNDRSNINKGAARSNFEVRFSYLPALDIVAACPQAGSSPSLLVNLFPNDTGKDTPNPANHHSRAARASSLGVFRFPSDVPCRPYRWAQWLAGLHFSPVQAAGDPIEPSTRAVVTELRSRVRTHAALAHQLKIINTKGALPLPSFQSENSEATGNIELRSWKELSGSELQRAAASFKNRDIHGGVNAQGAGDAESGAQSPRDEWERYGCRYFKGTIKMKRGRGKERNVDVQVEVPAEYPLRPSLISLVEVENSTNEDLLAILSEVNAHYDTLLTEDVKCWDQLLINQLSLIVECLVARPVGAFGRLQRGRLRRKPVLFDRLERTFVHR